MLWTASGPYRKRPFGKEADLEQAIKEVSAELFGPNRIYLDVKKKIGTSSKSNIPDFMGQDASIPSMLRMPSSQPSRPLPPSHASRHDE